MDTVNKTEKIVVQHKKNYGVSYYYPVNTTAKDLLAFVDQHGRRKCFTVDQIKRAKDLGLDIEVLPMVI